MGKRAREEYEQETPGAEDSQPERLHAPKRAKPYEIDRLSKLSDELILRVLSYLPISDLVLCQRLSNKYRALAGDSQLWKAHYYNRFVRPRASRLPGLKDAGDASGRLHFASKASKWLEDESLVERGVETNWKRQYKLRNNWAKGSCALNEIPVSEQPAIPPLLVQMQDGLIYVADQTEGMRVWSATGHRELLAQISFPPPSSPPTSLSVDNASSAQDVKIVVGFENGSFGIYALNQERRLVSQAYAHEPSSNGVVAATAIAWPYVVTMTATQLLSLYQFEGATVQQTLSPTAPPRLLHSLKSQTVWPPLTTSLKVFDSSILISVAYALPTYLSGWTVGIQEVKISSRGDLISSRLASAVEQHYRPLAFSTQPIMHHLPGPQIGSLATSTTLELRHIHSKPTSLSYTHPYLLVSHPDNTLTLYLVTSTSESLSISAGSRLWGHTSSVSGAHVGGRGKAISVSRRGDELRIWELEGGFASTAARKRLASGEVSVQIRPETRLVAPSEASQAGLDLVQSPVVEADVDDTSSELTLSRGWIGFDEENVVVLKERSQGKQALVIYDFT